MFQSKIRKCFIPTTLFAISSSVSFLISMTIWTRTLFIRHFQSYLPWHSAVLVSFQSSISNERRTKSRTWQRPQDVSLTLMSREERNRKWLPGINKGTILEWTTVLASAPAISCHRTIASSLTLIAHGLLESALIIRAMVAYNRPEMRVNNAPIWQPGLVTL